MKSQLSFDSRFQIVFALLAYSGSTLTRQSSTNLPETMGGVHIQIIGELIVKFCASHT